MLKNISNLGTSLNKSEQQSINGGNTCVGGYCVSPQRNRCVPCGEDLPPNM